MAESYWEFWVREVDEPRARAEQAKADVEAQEDARREFQAVAREVQAARWTYWTRRR